MTSPFEQCDPLKISVPLRLETQRLLLRRYELSDAGLLARVFEENRERLQDDFASRFTAMQTERAAEVFISHAIKKWEMRESFLFGIWDKQNRAYVGEVGLKEILWTIPKADVGYFTVREYEGKGMMTGAIKMLLPFAFDNLFTRKLQIRSSVENVRSQHVAERCGFKLEGTLRNDAIKADGRTVVDVVYHGMTESDYRVLHVKPSAIEGFT